MLFFEFFQCWGGSNKGALLNEIGYKKWLLIPAFFLRLPNLEGSLMGMIKWEILYIKIAYIINAY